MPKATIRQIAGAFKRHPRTTRAALLTFTFGTAFVVSLVVSAWTLACRDRRCPSPEELADYSPRQTSKLYANDGRFIAEVGLERRTLIPLSAMPKWLLDAVVVTEDKRFYQHAGVDWVRVFGAAFHNVLAMRWAQGFSTITMQLARNVFPEDLSREKSLKRKIREAKVARAIERRFTKDQILELYLNQISLGNGAYGVETAAQRYFGKSARDVNVPEAAMLAGLPQAPSAYNPRLHPAAATGRRNRVIRLMLDAHVISAAEASLARSYPLQLARGTEAGEVAPYFVEWVRKTLDEHFGKQLYEQGLKVYTTLDLDMQSAAERGMEKQIRFIEAQGAGPFSHITYEQYVARNAAGENSSGANSPYLQGAFVAIEPQTGSVRAMVGGRNYDDSKFNRATQAMRPAGSTFKPFVYADAIRNGRPPSYLVDDSPVELPQVNGDMWTPQNYDLKFLGPMTMRQGLYQSRNIIALKVGMELGEASVIETARRFGITTNLNAYPSINIGAADVLPVEMVAAYGGFATLGYLAETHGIIRVENQKGEVIWQPVPERKSILTAEEAWLMVNMMKDVIQRAPKPNTPVGGEGGTAWGAIYSRGNFRYPAAGKTGTTNDENDVWFIGYTTNLVAGVWMGFDNPKKIKAGAQGGSLAGPAWASFMNEVYLHKQPPPDWPMPDGIIARMVDDSTAMLASPRCPQDRAYLEYFIAGTEPIIPCDWHRSASAAREDSSHLAGPAQAAPVAGTARAPVPPPK